MRATEGEEALLSSVSEEGLPRTAVIGVLGGGQLGRMMAIAAANMDVRMRVLDPSKPAPASIAAQQDVGSFRDKDAILKFARDVDILTVEIEHVDVDAIEQVQQELDIEVHPSPQTLRVIQDKFAQKVHFADNGIQVPSFCDVPDQAALDEAIERFGLPLMLKAKRMAYDGRGNAVIRDREGAAAAVDQLGGFEHGLYAEQWAPFTKELAVMVARSRVGEVKAYPLVQTVHRNSICLVTEAPAAVTSVVASKARGLAERAISSLYGAGVFGVEMFLMPDGSVALNEVAPRPHNSGHYTIEGCRTSQFEQHVRAVLGWPLGDTSLTCASCVMYNVLGQAEGAEGTRIAHAHIERALATPGAKFHWYGKTGSVAVGRKIGHVTLCARSRAEGRSQLRAFDAEAAEELGPSDAHGGPPPRVGIIMGSDSDLPTMKAAAETLEDLGIPVEVTIVSAHRTVDRMVEYARTAHERGLQAIIAGAGGAAHLPGMVASLTPLPVIGVPCIPKGYPLDGVDAMLSILCMPKGVPVATVAIGNAANAGLLAARIIGAADPVVLDRMLEYQQQMRETVETKAAALEEQGWRGYLGQ
ncbi:unnamed protein product [Pedinophyceae sp. YPF-701]|nr:unnamed protein product [Pedinophyceae sp. YPF-701]